MTLNLTSYGFKNFTNRIINGSSTFKAVLSYAFLTNASKNCNNNAII